MLCFLSSAAQYGGMKLKAITNTENHEEGFGISCGTT